MNLFKMGCFLPLFSKRFSPLLFFYLFKVRCVNSYYGECNLMCCRMFVSRVLCTTLKRTTGLVGVPVIPNARSVLIELYDKTLENVKVGRCLEYTAYF